MTPKETKQKIEEIVRSILTKAGVYLNSPALGRELSGWRQQINELDSLLNQAVIEELEGLWDSFEGDGQRVHLLLEMNRRSNLLADRIKTLKGEQKENE